MGKVPCHSDCDNAWFFVLLWLKFPADGALIIADSIPIDLALVLLLSHRQSTVVIIFILSYLLLSSLHSIASVRISFLQCNRYHTTIVKDRQRERTKGVKGGGGGGGRETSRQNHRDRQTNRHTPHSLMNMHLQVRACIKFALSTYKREGITPFGLIKILMDSIRDIQHNICMGFRSLG